MYEVLGLRGQWALLSYSTCNMDLTYEAGPVEGVMEMVCVLVSVSFNEI
jgi:hypothetical protein